MQLVIVGQGIAGSVMALCAHECGLNVQLVDVPYPTSASRVAAGLWNPISFQRMRAGWMAADFIETVELSYPRWEQLLNASFYFPMPYHKAFTGVEQVNAWEGNKSAPRNKPFLGETIQLPRTDLNTPEGWGELHHAGYLDPTGFLHAVRRFFEAQNAYSQVSLNQSNWRSYFPNAALAIWAEGVKATEHELFGWLPFQPVKGEVVVFSSPINLQNTIWHKGCFIAPTGNGLYTAGSTYNWRTPNNEPSSEGLAELKEKIAHLIHAPITIHEHRAGVRPAVKGRKPLLGKHPEQPEHVIFNGMGSKSVLMAPYWAAHLLDHVMNSTKLNPEVNIHRFANHYYSTANAKN